MTTRRTVLTAAAALLAARPARAVTTDIALLPGRPRSAIRARNRQADRGFVFAIAFEGQGAPPGEIRLPTWYGDGRVLRSLPVAGREVLLASFQGNRGTGLAQRLFAVIGADDAGALRILGIETESFHDAQVTSASRRMEGVIEPRPERDALLLRQTTIGRIRPRPETSERWTTRLAWNGAGVLAAEATPPGAGEIRRRVDAARAQVTAILAATRVTDATAIDYDATGIWAVGYAEAVS
jgi:hypothetical protein